MNDPIELRLARLPKREAPPELIQKLKATYMRPLWRERLTAWAHTPLLWQPIGALAIGALIFSFWFLNKKNTADQIDLEPLLAAHSRYQLEVLVPQADLARSNFSAQLASYTSND